MSFLFPNISLTPDFKIVQKLETVPVVHDSVAYAEHLIKSTQLTQNLYQVALNIAQREFVFVFTL